MYTLSDQQAAELVADARAGDPGAWAELVEACDGYARKLASMNASGADFDDLYQAAVGDGLRAAIDTWNPERAAFGTWAWHKMRAAVFAEMPERRGVELALDGAVDDDGEITLADVLPDEDSTPADEICISGECMVEVRGALAEAVQDERDVAIAGGRLLAEEPMQLAELGELLGLSPQRVGQIEGELLERVRDVMEDEEE